MLVQIFLHLVSLRYSVRVPKKRRRHSSFEQHVVNLRQRSAEHGAKQIDPYFLAGALKPLKVYQVSEDESEKHIFTGILDDDSTIFSNPPPPPLPPFVPVSGCHDNPDFRDAYGYPCLSGYGNCTDFTRFGFSEEVIQTHLDNCPESCPDVTPTNKENPGEPCPERPSLPSDTRWRHASIEIAGNAKSIRFISGKDFNQPVAWAADAALDDVEWRCA